MVGGGGAALCPCLESVGTMPSLASGRERAVEALSSARVLGAVGGSAERTGAAAIS